MTFSLSPRASSRAMGRCGCPFGFLAFFNFFPKISFRILLRAVMICEESSQALKRNHLDRKSTRLNSSHLGISYAVFCLKKKRIHATLSIIGSLEYLAYMCNAMPALGNSTAEEPLHLSVVAGNTDSTSLRLPERTAAATH